MKKLIAIILLFVATGIYAQTTNDIYLIGATSRDTDARSGLIRTDMPKRDLDMSEMIFIDVAHEEKGYAIIFVHTNYNVTKLAKIRSTKPEDKQEIIEKPLSFLETINPIDLNEMNYEWQTAEEAWTFGENLSMDKMREQGKKIYFIDRTDITDTTVKLIEIRFSKSNRPKGPDFILLDENGNVIDSN